MERQLRAWGLDVTAANVTLYTTLKASNNRVSAAMMRKQGMAVQSVMSQGTTLNTSYWLVPINEGQPLAPALAKYKVPPELVSEASEGQVDFSRWHILDKSCPREKLGLGVSEIVLHMKHDTRFLAGDSQATGAKAGDSEATGAKARGEGAATGAQAEAVEVSVIKASASTAAAVVVAAPSAVSEKPGQTTLRELTRLASDDADASERRKHQVTVELVDSVKKAVAAGRYSSPDANDSTTVEFWARSVLETFEEAAKLREAAATGAAGSVEESAAVALTQRPIYKLFPAFVAKQLIAGPSYQSLAIFGEWFTRLAATGAVLPPLAVLIQRLAKYELTSSDAIATEGVSLEDRTHFFQSPLYNDFRSRRADAMLAKAKVADGAERIKILDIIIAVTGAGEEVNRLAVIAKTLFDQTLPMGDRVEYALKVRERASVAAQWQPDAPLAQLEPFTSIEVGMKDVSWASLSAGAGLILQHQKAAAVPHPVLKQVVLFMGEILAATGASEPSPDVCSFLCEVIGARLGCIHWRPSQPPAPAVWGDATLAIYKLTAKFVPSKVPWEGSNVHLLALKAQHEAAVTHAVVAATGAIADAAVAAFEKTLQASVSAATGACGGDSTTPSANQEEMAEDETTEPESTANAAEPSSAASSANSAGSAEKAAAASEQTLLAATGAAAKGAAASELMPAWMKPGATVLLSVKRNLELYNQKKAKIEAVLTREVKVMMLEGPKKGDVTKMNPMALSLVAEQEPPKKLFPETAATMAPPQPPPQKKQKTLDQEWAAAEGLLGM